MSNPNSRGSEILGSPCFCTYANSIMGTPRFIEAVYPSTTVGLLNDVRDVVLKLELHPLYFFRSSLRYSVYAMDGVEAALEMNMRLTDAEYADLADIGIYSIGDLLEKTVHGDKFIFNLNLADKVRNAPGISALEIRKLDRVVQNVKKHIFPGMLRQMPVKKFKKRN